MILLLFLSGKVPPEVTLPNRRIGQTVGRDTVLECVIMSSPQALYYWEKDTLETTIFSCTGIHTDRDQDGNGR